MVAYGVLYVLLYSCPTNPSIIPNAENQESFVISDVPKWNIFANVFIGNGIMLQLDGRQ